jgi:hypothetical protein
VARAFVASRAERVWRRGAWSVGNDECVTGSARAGLSSARRPGRASDACGFAPAYRGQSSTRSSPGTPTGNNPVNAPGTATNLPHPGAGGGQAAHAPFADLPVIAPEPRSTLPKRPG